MKTVSTISARSLPFWWHIAPRDDLLMILKSGNLERCKGLKNLQLSCEQETQNIHYLNYSHFPGRGELVYFPKLYLLSLQVKTPKVGSEEINLY